MTAKPMLSRLIQQTPANPFGLCSLVGIAIFRRYRVQHPLLGSLHYYDLVSHASPHTMRRHTKQLYEIIKVHKIS